MHIMRRLTAFLLCVLLGSGAILVGAVVSTGHPRARVFAEQAEGGPEGGPASEGTPPAEAAKADESGKRDKQEMAQQTEQQEKSESSTANETAETQEYPESSAKDSKSGADNESEINERPAQPESDHIPEAGGKSEPDDKNKDNGAPEPFDPVQSLDSDLINVLEQAADGQDASGGAPEKQPEEQPHPRQEEEQHEDTHADEETPAAGNVALGSRCELSGAPGDKVTLAISIDYLEGEHTYRSNRGAIGGIVSHPAKPVDVDQRIGNAIPEARVAILAEQEESFPLNKKLLRQEQSVVSGGVNAGYAVFAGARVRKGAVPGEYPLRLRVVWLDRHGEEHINTLTAHFTVLPGVNEDGDGEATVESGVEAGAEAAQEAAQEAEEEIEEEAQEEIEEMEVEEDEIEEEGEHGDVALGSYDMPAVEAGGALTLALPIQFERDGVVYRSNRGAQGGQIAFADGNPAEYDQTIAQAVSELWLSIDSNQPEDSPLASGSYPAAREIVGDGHNAGFAVFSDLEMLDGAQPGEYPVRLIASWLEPDSEDRHSTVLVAQVRVARGARAMSLDDEGVELGAGGWFDAPTGATTATLAVPISYTTILSEYNPDTDSDDTLEKTYATNAAAAAEGEQGVILPYAADTPIGAYDQHVITGLLPELSVEIIDTQPSDCPLDLAIPQGARALISGGSNNGYAVFEDVPLKPGLAVGAYPVVLRVAWKNAEGAEHAETITLHMTISDGGAAPMLSGENGIIVFTHEQLRAALEDSVPGYEGHSFDPVYLGSCKTKMPEGSWETLNNGIIRYPSSIEEGPSIAVARSATIIGTDPRTGTRLTVIDRTPSVAAVRVDESGIYTSVSGTTITVRDVTWQGYNPNGIVLAQSQGGAQFINVSYTGCRMYDAEAAGSWVSITDCTIDIKDMDSSAGMAREVARGGDIRLYGKNTITRVGNVAVLDSGVFALGVSPHKFTVAKGANVSANTNNVFLRLQSPAETNVAINGTLYVKVQYEKGAFTYGSENIEDMSVSGSLMIVDEGTKISSLLATNLKVSGSLMILDNGEKGDPLKEAVLRIFGSLHVSGSLQVETNQSLPAKDKQGVVYSTGSVNITGSLKIVDRTLTTTSPHYGTLHVNGGALTVSGSMDIEQEKKVQKPCILFTPGNTIRFDSPKRIDLKSPYGMVIGSRLDEFSLTMTTQVVNIWPSSGPKRIWNNSGLQPFSVDAEVVQKQTRSASPSGLADDTGAALEAVELNAVSLNFGKATRLLLGQYAASIDHNTVFYGSDIIRGTAPAGSTQTVREYDRSTGTPGTLRQDVAAIGSSQYHTGDDWQPISSTDMRIYLLTKLNDLEAHIYEEIQAALMLHRVPPELDFGGIKVSSSQRTLSPTGDQLVQVMDTRPSGSWTLSLSATPMTSDDGDVLDNALVFYSAEDVMTPLSQSDSVFVAAKPADAHLGITDVNWPEDCGIRMMVMPYEGEPGASYSATIIWTLEDA